MWIHILSLGLPPNLSLEKLNNNIYGKINEPVKVRTKAVKDGESLYLDINYNGVRTKEYLKLYLTNGTSRLDKAHNKEVMSMANAIKAQRILDIQNGRFGLVNKSKGEILLLDFLDKQREEYHDKGSHAYSYSLRSARLKVKEYDGGKTRLKDVNKKWIIGFIKFLKRYRMQNGAALSNQSIYTYYIVLSINLNRAVKYDYIPFNPCDKIPNEDKTQRLSEKREYLTLEEVQKMINAECRDGRVKRLFLFGCFTGLRISDMVNLRWKHIVKTDDGKMQIETRQQKTKELVYVPLSENAMQFLPGKDAFSGDENRVFDLPERSCAYAILHEWAKNAGITKNVIFHVARHTYATLLLYYGADIYTVSKLLGHQSVKTTQIYAKVVDESKRKAVDLIPEVKIG